MAVKDLFKQHYETGEHAVEKSLMTHYYKNNVKQAKEAVIEVGNTLGFNVKFEDDDRLELMLSRRDAEIIVSMVKITPIETAIDFTANTEQLITFGKGKKLIASMYEGLNQKLSFKGQALKR
ncbi:MAG TPA: hypothetical protein DCY20_04290 [Firmicutes bacterium]|nr:hypothetical protein [Bacillota bacterium]